MRSLIAGVAVAASLGSGVVAAAPAAATAVPSASTAAERLSIARPYAKVGVNVR